MGPDEITDDEVAAQSAEALPDREAMSLVKLPGPPGSDLIVAGDDPMPMDLVGGGAPLPTD